MKALSPEISALLDKLYNLRGEDSVILVEINKQRNKATEIKTRTTEEKKDLQIRIQELEQLYNDLNSQGEKLTNLLSNIDRDEYATVLDHLGIDFNPQNLVERLNKTLPRAIDSVTMDTKKAEKQLVRVEEEMNDAIQQIEDLSIRRDVALSNQEKLNEYFDLALSGRISITRDSIVSLLEQFGFNSEETREAAKILMFPEDALYDYDERVKEKEQSGKSISDVFTEAKNAEPIVEEDVSEDFEEDLEDNLEEEEDAVSIIEEEPSVVEFEESTDGKEALLSLLSKNGIDYLDYTGQEIDNLIQHFDEKMIETNIECVKNTHVGVEIFVNHTGLLLDEELPAKIHMLLNVGKEPIDIYLNPNVLEKYSKEELEDAIETIQKNGMDPKNVPLMAY